MSTKSYFLREALKKCQEGGMGQELLQTLRFPSTGFIQTYNSEGSICKWMSTVAVAPPNAFGVALWNSSKEDFVGNCNISTIWHFSCSWHVCMELATPKWVVLQWHYYRRGIFCLSHDINLIFNGGSKGWTLINPKLMNMTALHQLDFQ